MTNAVRVSLVGVALMCLTSACTSTVNGEGLAGSQSPSSATRVAAPTTSASGDTGPAGGGQPAGGGIAPVGGGGNASATPPTVEQACGTTNLLGSLDDFDSLNGWNTTDPPHEATPMIDTYGPSGHEGMPAPNAAAGQHFVYGGQVPTTVGADYVSRIDTSVTFTKACAAAFASEKVGTPVKYGALMGGFANQNDAVAMSLQFGYRPTPATFAYHECHVIGPDADDRSDKTEMLQWPGPDCIAPPGSDVVLVTILFSEDGTGGNGGVRDVDGCVDQPYINLV